MKKIFILFSIFLFIFINSCAQKDNHPYSSPTGLDNILPDTTAEPQIPSRPQNVNVLLEDTKVIISWNRLSIVSYNLYMHTNINLNKTNYLKKYENVISPFVLDNLISETTYYFGITAVNSNGEGNMSQIVSILTNNNIITTLEITPANSELIVNNAQQFTAVCKNNLGNNINNKQFIWKTDSTGVATIDSTGLAKGINPGTANISVSVDDKTATTTLKIIVIKIDDNDSTISKGTVHYDDTQCLSCHLTWPKIEQKTNLSDFKFGGDFILLCNGCHNLSLTSMHPVQNFSNTCQACHNACFLNRVNLLKLKNDVYNTACVSCHTERVSYSFQHK